VAPPPETPSACNFTADHAATSKILEKLEVHSKAEAVAFAFQKNLI
jgi:hypothetical protein